jgi:hypothetical protein
MALLLLLLLLLRGGRGEGFVCLALFGGELGLWSCLVAGRGRDDAE